MAVDKRSLLKPSSPVDNNACKSHTAVQLIGCWTICLSLDWQVQHQSEGGEGGIRNCVVQYHGEKLTVFMMTNKNLVLNNVLYIRGGSLSCNMKVRQLTLPLLVQI